MTLRLELRQSNGSELIRRGGRTIISLPNRSGGKAMIRLIGITAFAFVIATSAHAITLAPLHQPDNMITQVREACGVGMHYRSDLGRCVTTPARRQARRCLVWGAGHVCRKWG